MNNKNLLRFTALLLVFTFLILPFENIAYGEQEYWANEAIKYVKNKGIMVGNKNGDFQPDRDITRAEFARVINNIFKYQEKARIEQYKDVESGKWYYEDIQKAVAAGYMQGNNGLMRPDDPITREEAAIIIVKACKLPIGGTSVAKGLKDYNNISSWAVEYVDAVVKSGIMIGRSDGFKPKENITRAETAQIAYNIDENEVTKVVKETINGRDAIVIYNTKQSPQFKTMKLEGPRFVVDISNSKITSGVSPTYNYDLGNVKLVRTSQFDVDTVRVVLDIKEGGSTNIDVVTAGNRIILYPGKAPEPEPAPVPKPEPKPGNLVFLDAGHGGPDPGAIGNGINEKDITLPVALKTGEILKRHNVDVRYSRTTDTSVSGTTNSSVELSQRANMANSVNADVFVSIHCNSFKDGSAHGVETYSYPGSVKGAVLAKCIQDSVLESGLYTADRGTKTANFAVLRQTKMPAALIEMAFIKNKQDSDLLKYKQNEFAQAIAEGILKYLNTK